MKKITHLVLVVTCIFSIFAVPVHAQVPPQAFVLAGQSNMLRNQDNIEAALKETYGPDTLAIKTAKGGTSITQWQKGMPLYQSSLAKVTQAQQAGYEIEAILFHQGESDTKTRTGANRWGELFRRFINDFSTDINRPNIPVVYVQLGNQPLPISEWPYWENVRQEQETILSTSLFWRMARAQGLPYDLDDLPHYANKQYLVIANRIVANLREIVPVWP